MTEVESTVETKARRADATRRAFLKDASAAAVGAAALGYVNRASAEPVHAAGSDVLRIGLVGCGGRGTGAASQALKADKNVKLVAMGDVFGDRLESSLANLLQEKDIANKIDVAKEKRFVGFDAITHVINSGVDVMLLATPPHFRPMHLKQSIEAGKHVFAEKPCAVDAPGVRSVLESCELAKKKNLSVCSGLCLRYSKGFREVIDRIHAGEIGDVVSLQASDLRGPIWIKPRQSDWDDMTWQMRNWYYFTWLSGDFNVEQHVHFLDVAAWVMKEQYPATAVGCGGRQVRTGPEYGNIYDHHSVVYQYADGPRLYSHCRQQAGCHGDMSVDVFGSLGSAHISEGRLTITQHGSTAQPWKYRGEDNDIYQNEHDDLFASIRLARPINHGEYMAKSTLLAVLGRMATYSGQQVTWDKAFNSTEDLSPKKYEWGPIASPAIAIPGLTKVV